MLSVLVAGAALAQYRPPPMTDAERLVSEGDEARVEAAKAASFNEKEKATAKLKESLAAYEKALVADPKSVAAAIGVGRSGGQLKDWDRVITVLTPLQAQNPADADLAHHLGVALLKKRRYAEAEPLLAVAGRSTRSDLFINQYYQGWLALQRGDGDRTVAELQRYLSQRPPEVSDNDREILVLLGNGYLLLKDAPKAREAFQGSQKGRAEALGPQLGLAAVLELEGKQADAVKLLERLYANFPKAWEPRERLARLQLALGNLRRAEALAGEFVGLQDSIASHLLMADVQLALKKLPGAEREYRAVLKRAPTLSTALIGLANVLQAQGRHDEATLGLAQASAARPEQQDLLAALGSIYRRAGRHEPAIAAHQNLYKLNPDLTAQYLLGADYLAASLWDQAVATYSTILDSRPDQKVARRWLVTSLQRRAQARIASELLEDAVRDLRRAWDLDHSAQIARNLGAVLLTARQYADARTVLEQGTSLPGAGWQERYLLGWALLGTGDANAAATVLESAQAQASTPEAAAQVTAAWALARLEGGDADVAVKKLSETQGKAKEAALNLPLALLRRGLGHVRKGDAEGAQADLDAALKLKPDAALEPLAELLRALVALEHGRADLALAALKKALPPADKSPATTVTRGFLEAYVEYRRDRTQDARKKLDQARKAAKGTETWPDFARANARRDGELAYGQGVMARAERSLKESLLAGDPSNPYVVHNLACVTYRKGGSTPAQATWKSLAGAVPEATLNLGIAAHAAKDPRRAAHYYGQYLGGRGAYSGLAREWKDRVEAIYGASAEEPSGEVAP